MDWSLCESCKHTNLDGITDVLHIYDIMCQYHVHLYERVAASIDHSLLDTLRIIKAIGQFHVHGHQLNCLYRFSTTFIPGVGMIDGEILETLWSVLNDISRSTRSASLAHRMEVLDDHMGDSNWKKIINISESISLIFTQPDWRYIRHHYWQKISACHHGTNSKQRVFRDNYFGYTASIDDAMAI